jgi:D-glycero-alpha-D-manno-heptose-7-phosphate kinase
MKKITVRTPARVDLAGGTLDLWPLYLFHPGSRTVNVAVSRFAECEITLRGDSAIELTLGDQPYHRRYASIAELLADPRASLVARAVEHFRLSGLSIVTRTEIPRGSGLGGSSALAVALVRALSELAEEPVDGDDLVALVRDLETRVLSVPAGVQDYYPAVWGGVASLHLEPGRIARHPVTIPLSQLGEHLVVHYSGVSHFSGTNNWEIYKRRIDGDERVAALLGRIAAAAHDMEDALAAADFADAGSALAREWEARVELVEGISTPEIDQAITAALAAGAWGAKVCGAGGGGCIVFLTPAERRSDVVAALAGVPGETLDLSPVNAGLVVERSDEMAHPLPLARRARASSGEPTPEHLFVVSDEKGRYRPFVFVEAAVTFDDAHKGVHEMLIRSMLAPVDVHAGRVQWNDALAIPSEKLNLNALPSPDREMEVPPESESLTEAIVDGEAEFRELLLSTEKLHIYFNPAFGIYSRPGEPREAFVTRCSEEAAQKLESKTERLEASYRRRVDQIREKADRDQRAHSDDAAGEEIQASDVGIAWGQTLFNITSGRPLPPDDPQSIDEADYLQRIARIQKMWEREREELREELNVRARSIEELTLTPAPRNVEMRKYVVIWAPSLRAAIAANQQ